MQDNLHVSKLKFKIAQQPCPSPVPLSPMEINVRTVFEQHLSPQLGDCNSSINIDDEVSEKRNASSLGEDLECGK
jgi:hypothetical protein